MEKIENVAYGSAHERQVLDIYLPEGEVKGAFLYFHGGSSAGGYLSMMLCFDPQYLTAEGMKTALLFSDL